MTLPVLKPSRAAIVGKDDTTAATIVVPWEGGGLTSPAGSRLGARAISGLGETMDAQCRGGRLPSSADLSAPR